MSKPHKVTVERTWAVQDAGITHGWPIRIIFSVTPAGRKALAAAKGAKK